MREVTTLDEGRSGTFVIHGENLFAGTTLGAFAVIVTIGEGLIGEVCRTCDPSLDRDVADGKAERRAARGECPTAFDRRSIPRAYVAPRSNTAGIFPRRVLPDGPITGLGARLDSHHVLLGPGGCA